MKVIISTFILVVIALSAFAQVDPIDKQGLGIGGYDLVSYFTTGKAIKGDPAIISIRNGATYQFSSKENKTKFEADPEHYLPQFDGYCALAVCYGKKISIDPKTFKIVDDKLYLFYNGKAGAKHVNSIETWNRHEDRLLPKANELWPDVKKKKYQPEDNF